MFVKKIILLFATTMLSSSIASDHERSKPIQENPEQNQMGSVEDLRESLIKANVKITLIQKLYTVVTPFETILDDTIRKRQSEGPKKIKEIRNKYQPLIKLESRITLLLKQYEPIKVEIMQLTEKVGMRPEYWTEYEKINNYLCY